MRLVTRSAIVACTRSIAHRARQPSVGRRFYTPQFDETRHRVTHTLEISDNKHPEPFPSYTVIDQAGKPADPSQIPPELDDETLLRMYKSMATVSVMDHLLYNVQRQGRISFYMAASGEEATHVGTAQALGKGDIIYGQYREQGVLVHLGKPIQFFVDQCMSNHKDIGKGRQMPVHYGEPSLNFHTISSPLGTQIPQASGAGYTLRMQGKDNIAMCYFGDGAASEGDFHAAMLFAATLGCQTLFFCRNNGYAISTPVREQYRGDGIYGRGRGYGIDSIRVDGNDVFAVYNATKLARNHIIQHQVPVIIEAMTYRVGHHSTSDDSTRYRSTEEIGLWEQGDNPLTRFRLFLQEKKIWDAGKDQELRKALQKEVLAAITSAEKANKPPITDLFTDVYHELTPPLLEQQRELNEHLQAYPDKYDLSHFEKA